MNEPENVNPQTEGQDTPKATLQFNDWSEFRSLLNFVYRGMNLPELPLYIDSSGVMCRVMNTDHVTMVDTLFPSSSFSTYNVPESINPIIYLDVCDTLLSIFPRTGPLSLFIYFNKVKFIADGMNLQMQLVDDSVDLPEIPKVDLPVKFSVDRRRLLQILSKAKGFDRLTIITTENNITFRLLRGFGDEERSILNYEIAPIKTIGGEESKLQSVSTTYSLEHILLPLKIIPSDTATFECGNKQPCKLTLGSIIYWIAPRVDGE